MSFCQPSVSQQHGYDNMTSKVFCSEAWDHPNFRKKSTLGVKRPLSELLESSGVYFSEQLSEFEIPFSEWHSTMRARMKDFHLPQHPRSVFARIGVVPARQICLLPSRNGSGTFRNHKRWLKIPKSLGTKISPKLFRQRFYHGRRHGMYVPYLNT